MSQLNRNASYIFDVDGVTVWERLRVVRGFLKDRTKAYKLSILQLEELTEKNSKEDNKFELERRNLDIEELVDLIEDCEMEIRFLEDIESRLAKEAEKTRIENKTDKEMYELNFFQEHTQRLIQRATCEIISGGSVSPDTFRKLLSNKEAMHKLIDSGKINPDILDITRQDLLNYDEILLLDVKKDGE